MICGENNYLILLLKASVKLFNLKTGSSEDINIESEKDNNGYVLAANLSKCGRYLCFSDELKNIYLYENKEGWKYHSKGTIEKRCCKISFDKDGSNILIADKSGNILRIHSNFNELKITDLDDESSINHVILGHISILTDFDIQEQENLIASCDRDEKIRISYYPDSFEIYGYLLSHQKYVSQVKFINNGKQLVSAGGDGRLLIWDLRSKHIIDEFKFGKLEDSLLVSRMFKCGSLVFLFLLDDTEFHVIHIGDNGSIVNTKKFNTELKVEDAYVYNSSDLIEIFIVSQYEEKNNFKLTVFQFNQTTLSFNIFKEHFLNDVKIDVDSNERRKFLESLIKTPIDKSGVDTYFENKRKREKL